MRFPEVVEFIGEGDPHTLSNQFTLEQINLARNDLAKADLLQSYVFGRLSDLGELDNFLTKLMTELPADSGDFFDAGDGSFYGSYWMFWEFEKTPSYESFKVVVQSCIRRRATYDLVQLHEHLEGAETNPQIPDWLHEIVVRGELEHYRRLTTS
jgi:hypothetical protein